MLTVAMPVRHKSAAKRRDNPPNEREMTRHQRGLVDTCFEEGQYEAAIAVLDQLHSSKYKPAASHMRQLLFMALYPPPEAKENVHIDPASPRKAAKQQRSTPYPSQAATVASQRLLASLAITNSPTVLFRGLPCYSSDNQETTNEEEYSLIAREARCIENSKNCWAILADGFIQRKQFVCSTPKGKNAGNSVNQEVSVDIGEDSGCVADTAWPVLDWMIAVFELDEIEQVKKGLPKHSPILLSQIPSPRGGTGPRWEVDTPLEIVFYSLKQADQRRKEYGARLLTLLIDLTSTVHLDMLVFITSLYTRLSSFTADELSALFPMLPPSPTINRFKITLCQKYITYAAINPEISRPKPQARAQPRTTAAVWRYKEDEHPSSISQSDLDHAASITSKYASPTTAEILRLLEMGPDGSRDLAAFLRVKFELLVAFGKLQNQTTVDDQDSEWRKMLRDGKFTKVLTTAFDGELGLIYRETLLEIMTEL